MNHLEFIENCHPGRGNRGIPKPREMAVAIGDCLQRESALGGKAAMFESLPGPGAGELLFRSTRARQSFVTGRGAIR